MRKSNFRTNLLYYRFLKEKEESIKDLLQLEDHIIVPFNPSDGQKEIIKYKNILSFNIEYDKKFKVEIPTDFSEKFILKNIKHPSVGVSSDTSLFITDDCLAISKWFESWLNNNTTLKKNIFEKINIKEFPYKEDKGKVIIVLYFNDFTKEWDLGEKMFMISLTNFLNNREMVLSTFFYKFHDKHEFKLVYYNSDIYQELEGLKFRINPETDIDNGEIILYKKLKNIISNEKLPIANLYCRQTYLSQLLQNLSAIVISIDEKEDLEEIQNFQLNEINNKESVEEVFRNIDKINFIINDVNELLNIDTINKIKKNKTKIELLIILSNQHINSRTSKLENNIELLKDDFRLINIHLLDPLPFSTVVKTISVFKSNC
jgi:hypothetical protein